MPFDARAAKLLQAGEHLILPEHPGLRLAATPTRRSWTYRYKSPVDGGMRQVKLGEWPSMSYPAAALEWEKRRGERDSGVDLQLQKRSARRQERAAAAAVKEAPYSVADLVQDYLAGHIDLHRKPKGRAEVRRLLEQHAAPIALRPAHLLLRSEAYDLLQGLSDRPILMGQVRQEMGAAYDYGLDAGKLPESTPNWWRMVWRGKMPRSRGKKIAGKHVVGKRVLNEKEIGTLLHWLPNFSKTIADVLTLYLWTGTRGSEIVSMAAGEISEEPSGWWWTIPKEKTKNSKREAATDLRVPLIGRAKAIVQRRLVQATPFLFPSSADPAGRPIEQKVVQGGVYHHQPYSKTKEGGPVPRPRLPVSHWSPHDLRRTVRTQLAVMGCPASWASTTGTRTTTSAWNGSRALMRGLKSWRAPRLLSAGVRRRRLVGDRARAGPLHHLVGQPPDSPAGEQPGLGKAALPDLLVNGALCQRGGRRQLGLVVVQLHGCGSPFLGCSAPATPALPGTSSRTMGPPTHLGLRHLPRGASPAQAWHTSPASTHPSPDASTPAVRAASGSIDGLSPKALRSVRASFSALDKRVHLL
jgi:integrase